MPERSLATVPAEAAILSAARARFARDIRASLADVADDAGVSRATPGDGPPEVGLPTMVREAARTMAPRIGIARSLLFEATSGDPEATEAIEPVLRQLLGSIGSYIGRQMALGRIRPMHPILAA